MVDGTKDASQPLFLGVAFAVVFAHWDLVQCLETVWCRSVAEMEPSSQTMRWAALSSKKIKLAK